MREKLARARRVFSCAAVCCACRTESTSLEHSHKLGDAQMR